MNKTNVLLVITVDVEEFPDHDVYKRPARSTFVYNPARASKVYCDECSRVFGSRAEFERHLKRSSSESCPIDTAATAIYRFIKRRFAI